METQLMTDCLLRISGTITSFSYCPADRGAEERQRAAESSAAATRHRGQRGFNAAVTPHPNPPIPHHHHRTRDSAGRQQNTNVASTPPPTPRQFSTETGPHGAGKGTAPDRETERGGNRIPRSVKLRSQPNLFTPLLSASEGTRPPFENDQTFFLLLFFYHVNL